MPSLQVRDLPEQIFLRLRRDAEKEHRSFSQQAIVMLSRGLGIDSNPRQRRRELIEKIVSERLSFDTSSLPAPETLIRQDRQR
jgi:plasmid stability protein